MHQVAPGADGVGVDLHAALEYLGGLGVLQALVEGGATLAGRVLADGLADRLVTYVGPTVLGVRGHARTRAAGTRHDRRRRAGARAVTARRRRPAR